MNSARLLSTFLDLVRIDSLSRNEAAVAAYCRDAFEQAGCSVRIDETAAATGSNTGNLIAVLPGRLPDELSETENAVSLVSPSKLYFSAHMDTVGPGEGIEPHVSDGVIRSLGATILGGDDKVGIAAIIELAHTLAEKGRPHAEIVVLLSVCEEISLLGALAIDTSGFNEEPCFVLDGSGKPGTVVVASPFHYKFEATFTGKAAHAGIEPEKGISAIRIAAKAVLGMELGRIDQDTTANVGIIVGGNETNIIPDSCTITGEFRVMDESKVSAVQAQLASAMNNAAAEMGGEVAIEWVRQYPGFNVSEDDPLVLYILEQARLLGFEAKAVASGGGSDANIYANAGLKALVLGTGMTDVHGLNESLAIQDLEDLARLCIAMAYSYPASG